MATLHQPQMKELMSRGFASNYLSISALVVFIYDYCLTLQLEIELIWTSKWSYTKVLFLLIRYLPFIDTLFFFPVQFFILPSEHTMCRVVTNLGIWIMLTNIVLAEIVLSIRTWAIWRMNRTVGVILAIVVLATVTTMVYFTVVETFIHTPMSSGYTYPFTTPSAGITGCALHVSAFRHSEKLWVRYVVLGALQFTVLSPLAVSAYKAYRSGINGELSNIIHRDGILCYLCFFVLTMGYAILQKFVPVVIPVLVTSQYREVIMYSILTERVILNIRESGRRHNVLNTELHTTYDETSRRGTMTPGFVPVKFESFESCIDVGSVHDDSV